MAFFHHTSLVALRLMSPVGELWQDVLTEGLDERALLAPHVVQVHLVPSQAGQVMQPSRMPSEVRRDQHRLADVLGAHVARGLVELLDGREIPAEWRAEDIGTPLV